MFRQECFDDFVLVHNILFDRLPRALAKKHKGTGCDVGLVVRRLGLAASGQEGRRVDLRINDRGNFRGKDLGVVHASPPFDCQSRLFSIRQHAMCAAAGRPISSV